jgi:uncharacterized membrane protein YdfJ with MMPL/SSD domain
LILLVSVVVLVNVYGANTNDSFSLPGTDSQAAKDLLAEQFPPEQNGSSPIVFHTTTGKVTDTANKQAIEASHAAIVALPDVYSATDPFSQQGQGQISKDGTTAFIPVLLGVGLSDLTEEVAQGVLSAADPAVQAGMQVAAGGPVGSELSEPEATNSELIGIVIAMLILTASFGAIVAMGMPIATAIVGLVVGLSAIGLLGHIATVPSIAPTLATMIALGVGIDYALFLVSRHLANLRAGMDVRESIALTTATSGSAVVYAGGTVVIALLALAVAGIPFVTALGYASAVAVATAVLAAVTLLPALLSLAGHRITALGVPRFLRRPPKEAGKGLAAGWARFVTRHPVAAALGAIVLFLPLLIPFRALEFGQADIGAMPTSTTQRQAYDLMSAGFGVGYNGPLLVSVQLGTPAVPSSEYTSQYNEAQSLKGQLDQEQTSGTAQKQSLETQSSDLQKQQAALERQQSALESQSQSLQAQADTLSDEQAALRTQAGTLEKQAEDLGIAQRALARRQAKLEREALVLERQIGSVTRALARIRVQERATRAELERARTPGARRTLGTRLRRLDRRDASLEQRLAGLRRQEQQLRARERGVRAGQARLLGRQKAMISQAVSLARQAQTLAGESAALVQQKQDLGKQANQLQLAAANLQTQAADLQTQQAQLEGVQQQATTQQQQAEQLKAELTAELTQAGGDPRGTDPRLVGLQDALGGAEGVAVVSPPQIDDDGGAAVFTVIATTAPASEATADLVGTPRAYTIPQAIAGTDLEAFVGGSTAGNVDLAAAISSRLGLVILVVIGLSFLVLMAAFRSIVVPAQAALANVLAVCAAFGVLTAVFQWGWGLELIGVDTASGTVPIASYVPLMMFAVLFGLSMDYQVFLLSQVDHHRSLGEGPVEAIANGLAASARVIVSAALIMIGVFGSFVLNGNPTIKQFGVGLAVGVALAATMVLTVAPAVLTISGKAGWWLPERLGRVLPNIDIEGSSQTAETSPAEATAADAS